MPPRATQRGGSRIIPVDLWNFRRGLFYDRPHIAIPPGGASAVANTVSLDGILRSRPGLEEVYPTGSAVEVYHISQWVDTLNVRELLRATRSGSNDVQLHRYIGGSWSTVGSALSSVANTYKQPTSVNFKGEWFFCPGESGNLMVYDGTSFVTVESRATTAAFAAPAGPILVDANPSRLFLANVKNSAGVRVPYRLHWSDTLLPDVWNGVEGAGTSRFLDFAEESEPITAIYADADFVLVFKARTIYFGRFVGPPIGYTFRRLARGPGCISQATLKEYRDGLLIWLGDDNVYLGSPGQIPKPIAGAIEDRIRAVVATANIDSTRAIIDRDNHLYHLFFPRLSDSNRSKIFTINLVDLSWWEGDFTNTGMDVASTYEHRTSGWTTQLLVGSADGKIYEHSIDHSDDNGTAFVPTWTSGLLSPDTMMQGQQQVSLQEIRGYAEEGEIKFTIDHGDGLDQINTSVIPQNQVFGNDSALALGGRYQGEHFRVKVELVDVDTRLHGIGLGWIPSGAQTRGKTKTYS